MVSKFRTAFGQRLQRIRELRGESQTHLSSRSGLKPSAISHFEAGRRLPNLPNLLKLADSLDVTTDELLGRDDV
jgi:transcriptional regulator with XRE-family HTH domain